MPFDPELATKAWMATLSGAARAKSDAYFEGGYWLLLWGFVVTLVSAWIMLRFGLVARISTWAQRRTSRAWLRSFLFAVPFLLLSSLITLPWDIYTGFVREQAYGLSNMTFTAWLGEDLIGLAISTVTLSLLFIAIHAVIRRAPRDWWLLGTAVAVAGMTFAVAIAPLFIEPLFNKYVPLPAGPVRQQILSMARANGVPADNVYLVDASRQSKRISANVAGLFGTTRIALNDNLLKQPADEIRAVMGHEMGHYVLNHVVKFLVSLTLILAVFFLVTARLLPWVVARHGPGWGITGMDDPAILAPALVIIAGLALLATPLFNTMTRTQEIEADRFGLNAARAPDSFASIAMKLSQYRKIEPGPWEEAIFFDHPSGHTRVLTAMRWKAEHLGQADVK